MAGIKSAECGIGKEDRENNELIPTFYNKESSELVPTECDQQNNDLVPTECDQQNNDLVPIEEEKEKSIRPGKNITVKTKRLISLFDFVSSHLVTSLMHEKPG